MRSERKTKERHSFQGVGKEDGRGGEQGRAGIPLLVAKFSEPNVTCTAISVYLNCQRAIQQR